MRDALLALLLLGACSPAPKPETQAAPTPPGASAGAPDATPPPAQLSSQVATAEAPAPSLSPSPPADAGKDLAERDLGPALEKAAELIRKRDWSAAAKELAPIVEQPRPPAEAHLAAAASALLGRAHAARMQLVKAKQAYAGVLALYADGSKLAELGPSDAPETAAKLRVLADAVCEARFHEAEQKWAQVEKMDPPKLRKGSSKDEVLAFIQDKLGPWLKKRLVMQSEVDALFADVLAVKPAPSPRWALRAAQRVGASSSALVQQVESAPLPKEWQGDGQIGGVAKAEIRAIYREQLARVCEPFVERARGANKKCVELAATFSLKMPEADACAAWLAASPAQP